MGSDEAFDISGDSRVPGALAKAMADPFDYAMALRDGTTIWFTSAKMEPGSEWVHLTFADYADHGILGQKAYSLERGLDVRLSDVMWVADAPRGS